MTTMRTPINRGRKPNRITSQVLELYRRALQTDDPLDRRALLQVALGRKLWECNVMWIRSDNVPSWLREDERVEWIEAIAIRKKLDEQLG